MSNTSATGGVLSPAVTPAPLEGDALQDFFHDLFAGITGLDSTLIRPRWQPEPANIPATGTDWLAFGVTNMQADTYAAELHEPDGSGYNELRRHQTLTLLLSFYGPNAGAYCDRLRDGLQVSQNREPLQLANMGLVATGDARSVPELVKQRWYNRVDCELTVRRQIVRKYDVLNLLSGSGEIKTADVTVSFET